jgi:hypothetical protein
VTLGFRGVIEQLADDVTDGEDVEHVGAHLDVGIDEAAVYDSYACFISGDFFAVGGFTRSSFGPPTLFLIIFLLLIREPFQLCLQYTFFPLWSLRILFPHLLS